MLIKQKEKALLSEYHRKKLLHHFYCLDADSSGFIGKEDAEIFAERFAISVAQSLVQIFTKICCLSGLMFGRIFGLKRIWMEMVRLIPKNFVRA